MSFSKLVRLGKDAELAITPNGKNVCKITAAYDIGYGDNKKTVWIEASWWGDRAAKVAQYMTKGAQIVIHANDIEPDAYQGKNGLSVKLKMNVISVELIAKQKQEGNTDYQQPAPPAQQQPGSGFNDFDDDIPF